MPNSLQAVITRTAISPRLAIRIFLNGADGKESLPVLHRLSVEHELAFDDAGGFRLDLVHQLHALDNAKDLAGLHAVADGYKGRGSGRRTLVESADDGRL